MSLVELCSSNYNHLKLDTFGKKYYQQFNGNKIICEECATVYINDVANKLTEIITRYLERINMKDLVLRGDIYREEELNIITNAAIHDYMQYILPIKFSIKTKLFYEEYVSNIEDEYEDNLYKLARVNIESINCVDQFPVFNMILDLRSIDTTESINDAIKQYISSYVDLLYYELTDEVVKILMTHSPKEYTSTASCSCSSSAQQCISCNSSTVSESYVYNNRHFCLNCMYDIVVNLAKENNITDEVGLSIDNQSSNSTNYAIVNTPEWKRTVISKYQAKMSSLGIPINITHYTMTLN